APPTPPTLSLHDALPILPRLRPTRRRPPPPPRLVREGPAHPLLALYHLRHRLLRAGQHPLVRPAHARGYYRLHRRAPRRRLWLRSEEHTSELQSRFDLVC